MPNWTTGPWKAEPCVDMAGFETGKLWIIMRSQPMAYDFDRWEDARLAASAPDLLEALQFYANSEIYKPHPHGPAFDDRDLSFRARAAIAKATGAAS